jgi:Fe2+ or Zn2+ uptake regulation protein
MALNKGHKCMKSNQLNDRILLAESILSSQGYKVTQPRQILLEILIHAERPLKPVEICEIGRQRHLDRVSVYRVLEVFERIGLIHTVSDLGYFFCSNINHLNQQNKDQHLFLICEKCDSVEEAKLPEKMQNSLISFVLSEAKFKLNGAVQISGSCSKCSA